MVTFQSFTSLPRQQLFVPDPLSYVLSFLGCLKLAKQVLELPPAINMSCHSFLLEKHMTPAI